MQKIQKLSFDEIRAGLIATLKETDTFKSYDFEASGLNSIINILAYNTHMIGFYVRMMLSESFVDSAKLKQSMLSHAKLMGYMYKGRRAARVELFVRYDVPESQLPDDMKVVIRKGTRFESNTDKEFVKRSFVVIDDFPLTNVIRNVNINGIPHARFVNTVEPVTPLVAYEGELETWRFIVPDSQAPHRFVIKRDGVDPSSIKVKVYDTQASETHTIYTLNENALDVDGNSPVFYVTTSEDGFYELVFGNNVFGRAVQAQNMIEVDYIVSTGSLGNSAGTTGAWSDGVEPVTIAGRAPVVDITWWTNRPDEYANYVPISTGGMDEETVDELRFNIPHAFKRQNRIVTEDDYKSVILSEFRNVESISVWGGERNHKKEYGKVFVCIKPKFTNKLSNTAKRDIADNILKHQGMVGSEVVFMDPDFVKIGIEFVATYNKSLTNLGKGQIESAISQYAREYESKHMGTFESNLSDVDMLDYIRTRIPAIKSIFSRKAIYKDATVRYAGQPEIEVIFGNTLEPGSVSSNVFFVNSAGVYLNDNGTGSLYLVKQDGSRYSSTAYGSIDYETGAVNIEFPYYFNMVGDDDKGTTGNLRITAKCVNPDINTYLNNIIRIDTVKATANG